MEFTVSLPCFYKRRGKNISGPKNCHLLSLPRTYQLIDFALDLANIHCSTEKLKLFSWKLEKIAQTLNFFTFFLISFNLKNRLIAMFWLNFWPVLPQLSHFFRCRINETQWHIYPRFTLRQPFSRKNQPVF